MDVTDLEIDLNGASDITITHSGSLPTVYAMSLMILTISDLREHVTTAIVG